MFKVKNNMAPNIFNYNVKTIAHKYTTKYSIINFNEPLKTTKYSKYAISARGPYLWNNFLDSKTKNKTSLASFRASLKKSLFNRINETN